MRIATLVFCWLLAVPAAAVDFGDLTEQLASGQFGSIKAVVIAHGGEVVYEEYFRGTQRDDLHHVHSVTKSVGSTLVGIAHGQGRIDLDTPLLDLFSAYYPMQNAPYLDKRHITVEQVLQQRHGVDVNEWETDYRDPANPISAAINSGDWYRWFLRQPMEAQPGTLYRYSTLASNLMSRMIRVSTGQGPAEFAEAELFGPLGIENYRFEGWSGDGQGWTDWPNPDEDEPLGFTLQLRPLDMLKIGQLYLDGGVWDGQRILTEEWIRRAWTTYSNPENTTLFQGSPDSGYGYQWWKQRVDDQRGRRIANYYASGWARQHIMVMPELDLVVVSVSDDYDYRGSGIGVLLRNTILVALDPIFDERYNGAWYDPAMPGQGLTLETLADGKTVVGFWYTWDDDGQQRWFIMNGQAEGSTVTLSVTETRGGRFLQADPVEETEWATATLQTVDCDRLAMQVSGPEVDALVPLVRLTGECLANP